MYMYNKILQFDWVLTNPLYNVTFIMKKIV